MFERLPSYPLSPGQAAAFMKIRKDFSYAHPGAPSVSSCTGAGARMLISCRSVSTSSGPGVISSSSGAIVAAMPRQELLLYLCAHGAHTGWFRLKWLCDVAELTDDDGSGIDMPGLIARAHDLGVDPDARPGTALGAPDARYAIACRTLCRDASGPNRAESGAPGSPQALLQDERYWSTDDTPVSWMPSASPIPHSDYASEPSLQMAQPLFLLALDGSHCRRIRLPKRLFPLYFVLAPFLWIVSVLRRCLPATPVAVDPDSSSRAASSRFDLPATVAMARDSVWPHEVPHSCLP